MSFPRVDNLTVQWVVVGLLTIRGGRCRCPIEQHCGCDKVSIAHCRENVVCSFSCALYLPPHVYVSLPIAYSVDTQCDGYNECWHTTRLPPACHFGLDNKPNCVCYPSPQPQLTGTKCVLSAAELFVCPWLEQAMLWDVLLFVSLYQLTASRIRRDESLVVTPS